jgi:mRNA-degrading endonuclease RelE of RelBE toxin-antitoxin system
LIYAKYIKNTENLYRFRIGDYRAVFEIDSGSKINIILILAIGHRKDIYK